MKSGLRHGGNSLLAKFKGWYSEVEFSNVDCHSMSFLYAPCIHAIPHVYVYTQVKLGRLIGNSTHHGSLKLRVWRMMDLNNYEHVRFLWMILMFNVFFIRDFYEVLKRQPGQPGQPPPVTTRDAPPLSAELMLKVLPLSVTMAAVGLLECLGSKAMCYSLGRCVIFSTDVGNKTPNWLTYIFFRGLKSPASDLWWLMVLNSDNG